MLKNAIFDAKKRDFTYLDQTQAQLGCLAQN